MDDSSCASTKQCPRCEEWKPLTAEFFYPNKTKVSGFSSECKVCTLAKVPSIPKFDQDRRKQCKACKEFFLHTSEFFGKRKTGINGLDNLCKKCRREYKIAAYMKEHPPKPKEVPDGFKKCTSCLQILPATLEYFHAHSRNLDGLRTPCKRCLSKMRAHPRATKCGRPGYKICSQCLKELPATKKFFTAHPQTLDKLNPSCKQCQHNKYRSSHTPRVLVSNASKGFKRCSECRKALPATLDYFHALSKEKDGLHRICKPCRTKIRTGQRLQRIDKARAYEREARRRHPEHTRNRRARRLSAQGSFTEQDVQQQYKRQGGKCYYCKTKFDKKRGRAGFHADHIVPLTREGSSNFPWNIVLSCPTCNLKKGNKLPHEWPEGNRLL